MAAIDQAIIQGFVNAGINGATTAVKGRALEDLICYLFGLVPGIVITHRNTKNTFNDEEIDVALFNDDLTFLPNIILVEAKNWSNRVGSIEVAWFLTKLHNRGLDLGILVTTLGITGNADDLTAAHSQIALAAPFRRRLVVLTVAEIQALPDTDELIKLIKLKICELVASGSIG